MHQNLTQISAKIVEIEPLRYTPAGIPAINIILLHESQTMQSGIKRQIKAQLKASAIGDTAQKLENLAKELKKQSGQTDSQTFHFTGFLASMHSLKSPVLQITQVQQYQSDTKS